MVKAELRMRDGNVFEVKFQEKGDYDVFMLKVAQRSKEGRTMMPIPGKSALHINLDHLIFARVVEDDADAE